MRYVVIGASAAGISGAKTLREIDKEAEIILISKDEHIISRCMLHQFIDGKRTIETLNFANPGNFTEAYHIQWMKGVEVTGLDAKDKKLTLSNGKTLSYDRVLIATGASSFIPPVENLREANKVVGLRDLEDAVYIKEMIPKVKNVVVLGAGLVGIDAVSGLLHTDVHISLVEMGNRILPLQLDEYTAGVYQERFKENGVDIRLGVSAQKVIMDENKNPTGLLLNTGEVIPCELIIVATGVRSNVKFLEGSGVETDRFGLIVNAQCATNTRDVYGAGDVTGRNPIWPNAVKQGIVAANSMANNEISMNDFFGSKNTMNFLGIATMSIGVPIKPDDSYIESVEKRGKDYRKVIHKDGKIYGVIVQGDLSYIGGLTQLIQFKLGVGKLRKSVFKIDYSDFFNVKANEEFTY